MTNFRSKFADVFSYRARRPFGVGPLEAAIAVVLVFVAASGLPVSGATLVPEADLPTHFASSGAFVDLFGDGRLDLLLAGPEGVVLLEGPEAGTGRGGPPAGEGTVGGGRWRELLRLPPLPAPVTAAAAADVTGDGVKELILGTGQAGAVYVLGRSGTGWTLLAQTPYMWSPVRSIVAADFDGDGRAEIVAVSREGAMAVYGWDGFRLEAVAPPSVASVTHVEAAAEGGLEAATLFVAEAGGRLSLWSWPWSEPEWQTFVWGMPSSLSVFPDASGRPTRVVVTTYEKLLYLFTGDGRQFSSSGVPLHDPRLPFHFAVPASDPTAAETVVLAATGDGLGLWRITSQAVTPLASGWAETPVWAAATPQQGTFIVGEGDRPPSLWRARPGDYFRFTVDGRQRPLMDAPLFRQSQVMLSSRDWAGVLGLQLHWDPERQRITLFRGLDFAVLTMDEGEVLLPRGTRPLSLPPVNEGGRTYMPPELPVWFGYDYRWDPRTRTLDVTRRGQGIPLSAPNLSL